MAKRSKLDRLPHPIKAELIEKILIGAMSYKNLSQWLLDKHGVNASPSVVWRFAQTILTRHRPLVELGMPIEEIIKRRPEIEALGVEQVKQQILDKLTEKNGSILAYLDKTEASQ